MTIAEPYIKLHLPKHAAANTQGKVREHVYKAIEALGKLLPKGTHVHHIDNNPRNNSNSNLIICSSSYHRLLHARTDAYNVTGNANKMKCPYCKEYDLPKNMYVRKNQYQAWHRECANKYKRVENPKTGPYKYAR